MSDDRASFNFGDADQHAVLRSVRENGTDRRRPRIWSCCGHGDLNARQCLDARLGAGDNPRAYEQMVPLAPARIVACGSPSPGYL
jgi:hypothetical protein